MGSAASAVDLEAMGERLVLRRVPLLRFGGRRSSTCVEKKRRALRQITEHNRFGGLSVMVWGGISGDGRTELVVINGNLNADRYINEVLTRTSFPT